MGRNAPYCLACLVASAMKVRPILWFWLFAALVVFAGSVKAETAPKSTVYCAGYQCSQGQSTALAACVINAAGRGWGDHAIDMNYYLYPGQPYCYNPQWGAADYRGFVISTMQACPSGWTEQNGECYRADCPAGESRELDGYCRPTCGSSGAVLGANGICVCPQGAQRYNETSKTCGCDAADTPSYKGKGVSGVGSTSPSTVCNGGCTMTTGGLSVAAGGHWSTQIVAVTGSTCTATPSVPTPNQKTPTEDTRTPEQKCLASGGGFITTSSGTVCTDAGDSPVPVVKKAEEKKVEKDAAGAVTGTTETVTECAGNQCTTTTTTKDANGNVTGSTVRQGTGSGAGASGSGAGGVDDGPDECEKFPDRIGCADKGTPTDGDALPTENRGVASVTPVSFGASASCPADVNLPKGAKLSYAYPCQMATSLRPVILAIAWLIAGFIVMGAFRDA